MDAFNSLSSDLFQSNKAPEDSELASAREMLLYCEVELPNLSSQISNAKELLRRLEDKKRTLDKQAPALRQLVSPIRCVPPEIICRIFELCLDGKSYSPIISLYGSTPVLLTHICRAWRQIAITTPSLWTGIFIDFTICNTRRHSKDICSFVNSQLNATRKWVVRRSGSLLLNISIVHGAFQAAFSGTNIRNLYYETMDVFFTCHLRWRNINIWFRGLDNRTLSRFPTFNPHDVPMLRTLNIKQVGHDPSRSQFLNYMPILTCPGLKKLSGFRLDKLNIHKHLIPCLSTLAHLDGSFQTCSMSDIPNILCQCTALVNLRLYMREIHVAQGDLTPMEMPDLRYLNLTEEESNHLGFLLDIVTAPNVTHLSLNGPSSMPTTIINFLKRSQQLTTLELRCTATTSDVLITALRCCPQLKCLDGLPLLEDVDIDMAYNNLLTRLVDADEAGDVICPGLEYLDAGHHTIPVLHLDTLRLVVVRKTSSSHRLVPWEKLKAAISCQKDDETELQELLAKWNCSQVDLYFVGYCCPRDG